MQARVLNYGMSNVVNRENRPGEDGYVNHIEDYLVHWAVVRGNLYASCLVMNHGSGVHDVNG